MTNQLAQVPVWTLIQAWASGAALGAIFFGGLWLTVRRLLHTDHAALWVLGSFVLRCCVALLGFYLVAGGGWKSLLTCLLGFVMARQLLMRLTRSSGYPAGPGVSDAEERRHAP